MYDNEKKYNEITYYPSDYNDNAEKPKKKNHFFRALMAVVSVLDYIAPVWITNKGGGSPSATRGATAGMVVGLFFPPWGLLLGPFVGALLGELLTHATAGKALRVALLSFLAFLLTTGFKLLYGVAVLIMMW